jgi:hypothetical protein
VDLGEHAVVEKFHATPHFFVRHISDLHHQAENAVANLAMHALHLLHDGLRTAAEDVAAFDEIVDGKLGLFA